MCLRRVEGTAVKKEVKACFYNGSYISGTKCKLNPGKGKNYLDFVHNYNEAPLKVLPTV